MRKQTVAAICVAAALVVGTEAQPIRACSTSCESDPSTAPLEVLETFLFLLAESQFEEAYALVAPGSKAEGDPIAYRAALDFASFQKEIKAPAKFKNYQLRESHWEDSFTFRQRVTLDGWDNDEAMIVCEGGQWYVADPIHIIR